MEKLRTVVFFHMAYWDFENNRFPSRTTHCSIYKVNLTQFILKISLWDGRIINSNYFSDIFGGKVAHGCLLSYDALGPEK